jgi:RNA polymerase sigma-70 factor (ECF subfamily)
MQPGDEELMQKVKKGDVEAFDILVRRWENRLFNVIYRITGDFETSRDIRQEVFLRVYQSAKGYRSGGHFSTWLYRIAINCGINELRKRKRRQTLSLSASEFGEEETFQDALLDSSPGPDEIIQQSEMDEQVRAALNRLPDEQRVVIVLRHYEGLKFHQIASILNCPLGTVKSRMHHGLEQLRAKLKRYCWEGEASHGL